MSDLRRSDIPDDVVARRLEELAQIDRLSRALRDVQFVDESSAVRDGPAPPWNGAGTPASNDPPEPSMPS